jgi:hypothetical protein
VPIPILVDGFEDVCEALNNWIGDGDVDDKESCPNGLSSII